MGGYLVRVALSVALVAHLDHAPTRLLLGMANTARDKDTPPRYFAAREDLCLIMGRRIADEPTLDAPDYERIVLEREAALAAVGRPLKTLRDRGIVTNSVTARPGHRAEFTLPIDLWNDAVLAGAWPHDARRSASPSTRRSASPTPDAERKAIPTLNVPPRKEQEKQRREDQEEDHHPARPHEDRRSPVHNSEALAS